jgi:hypothetical protein
MPLLPPDDPWPLIQNYGYTAWAPQTSTLRLMEQVGAVIDTYIAHLPLTVRQIYYRLIASYDYPKTKAFAVSLSAKLTMARRALWQVSNPALPGGSRLLFDAIRDDKVTTAEAFFYRGTDDFFARVWHRIRKRERR